MEGIAERVLKAYIEDAESRVKALDSTLVLMNRHLAEHQAERRRYVQERERLLEEIAQIKELIS